MIATETTGDGTMKFDLCGADVEINPKKRTLKIHMKNYVEFALQKWITDAA